MLRPLAIVAALAVPAAADDDALPDLVPASITATSTLASKTDHYAAWRPFVGKAGADRLWCEGKPDEGIGEALVVTFGSATKLDAISISAGVWKSDALFRANNRVMAIDVTTDDGRKVTFAFPDARKPVSHALGGTPVKQLRFALASVKKGTQNDSCISEVSLSFPGNAVLVVGADHVPPLAPALDELRGALSSCDEATLRSRVKFPLAIRAPSDEHETYGPPVRYAKLDELMTACKRGKLWGTEGTFEQGGIVSDQPDTIVIGSYPDQWTLVLDGGAWKLTAIEDNSA